MNSATLPPPRKDDMTMLSLGYCILGVMLCITTFFLAKKHPNRISNGFILELAVILLLESLLGLTAAHLFCTALHYLSKNV